MAARWEDKRERDTIWYLDEPPLELSEVVEARQLPVAPTLDVGCGFGVVTAYLAERFPLSVGVDVAPGAVERSRARGRGVPHPPVFVLAQAPVLPFRDGIFAMVFERGVLQFIPRPEWPEHFRTIARLLRGGGLYLLYHPHRPLAPRLSYRGLRARATIALGRGSKLAGALRSLTPPSMEVLAMRKFTHEHATGSKLIFTYVLLQKRDV